MRYFKIMDNGEILGLFQTGSPAYIAYYTRRLHPLTVAEIKEGEYKELVLKGGR